MSINTDEAEVQLVEHPTSNDRHSSTATAKTETSRSAKRRSDNRPHKFARQRETPVGRSLLFSQDNDPRPQPSHRKSRPSGDFRVPGSQLTKSPKSIPRAVNTTTKPPLDTDRSNTNPPKPLNSSRPLGKPADSHKSRFYPTHSRHSNPRQSTEYNRRTLQVDRAKREGNPTLRNSSTPAAPNSKPRAHAINLDDDTDDVKPVHSVNTRQSPPRPDEEQSRVRRSKRVTNMAQNQVDRKEKVPRASNPAEDDATRGAKGITATEISYDGPRDLIFMYPPGERGNIRVTTEERERLKQHKYLNDSLIDFYLKFLETDLRRRPPPLNFATKFFSSFFFGVLRRVKTDGAKKKRSTSKSPSIDYSGVKNWTRGFDLFATDFVIVPICDSFHWSLIIVANLKNLEKTLQNQQAESKPDGKERDHVNDPGRPKIIYLDSMDPDRGGDLAIPIRHYLVEEWLARKKGYGSEDRDNERTTTIKAFRRAIPLLKPNVPVQNNEYDCGLYLLNNLSMFLNNTQSFMAKMLQGDLDMKMTYSSGDITKFRKSMTYLMDLFEEEWKQRNEKSSQTPKINGTEEQKEISSGKKTPPLGEEENGEETKKVIDVPSAVDEGIEEGVHVNHEQVPCRDTLLFPAVEAFDIDSDDGGECAPSSGQESCRSPQDHMPSESPESPMPMEHANVEAVDVTHVAGPQHVYNKDVDVNITSPSERRIELSEEEPESMDCDNDASESEGSRDPSTVETRSRYVRLGREDVQTVDITEQQDDAVMSVDSHEGEGAIHVKRSRSEVSMDLGAESDDEEMGGNSSAGNDVGDAGAREIKGSRGLGVCQQQRSTTLAVKNEDSVPLYEDDQEEVLDGGDGDDMEEPFQTFQSSEPRRVREVLCQSEQSGFTGGPLPGYAGRYIRCKDGRQNRRGRLHTRFSDRGRAAEK